MVYLENKTELQEIWIPRNDGQGVPHKPSTNLEIGEITVTADTQTNYPSSGYVGFSSVVIDSSEYAQQNYDLGYSEGENDGYVSGVTDGEQSIIDTFTSTTITQNGQYGTSANPYSSVTVNVQQTGHTDEELQEAYNSGYTSGETHQKSLLASTAFTQNGQYTRENGWSGITVNIDTASTYNSGYTSGYTSGHTDGVDEEKAKMSAVTFTANTAVTLSDGSYSAVTVNVPQTGSTAVLGVGSFSANGTYSASTDNLDGYSAITINVQTGTKEIVMCVSGGCWFNTNYLLEYGDQIEFEHCTFGKYGAASASRHQQYLGGGSGEFLRIGTGANELYLKYFYNSIQVYRYLPSDHSLIEDETVLFNSTGFTIGDNVVTAYTTTSSSTKAVMIFFANTASGADSVQNQTAKMGRVKVYSYDGTLKATFEPRLDEFNVPYFKYIEEDIDIYASGNTAPFYEEIIINEDYQSGYTDGYASGYTSGVTDGENNIISTFSSTTATTNGVYGSSANPLSSITVNVPQTGSSVPLSSITITANTAITETQLAYSAITVNVPQTGGSGTTKIFLVDYIHTETIPINDAEINTGIYASTDISIRIKCLGKGYQLGERGDNIFGFGPNEGASDYDDFRLMCYDNNTVLAYDWRSDRIYTPYSGLYDGMEIDYTCGNYYVYDNIEQEYLITGNTKSSVNESVPIYVNVGKIWLKSFEIWKGQTKVFDGVAAYDENGNIGLYDSVSKELVYNSNLQMAYEIQRNYTIDDLARRNYNIADPTINVSVLPHSFQNAGLTGQLTLTNAVSNVYTFAFYGNPITGITWPTSTIWINGPFCFSECGLQGKLIIPSNVRFSLVDTTFSFYNCTGITSVEFYANSGNPVVPKECFSSCENITDVDLYDVSTIKQEAFYGCSALALINVHSTVAPVIEDYTCFSGISSSGTVHYPSGADYSSWQSDSTLSGWTFIADL